MDLKIIQISQPTMAGRRRIQAVSENGIVVSFPEPDTLKFGLDQQVRIDLEAVDVAQIAVNLTTGEEFRINIPGRDIHDVRLPMAHGKPRFPSLERRRGA